jgi:aminopeptidase N
LNIFNAAYVLADAATATDADFEAIESVVAHEYFHNWTGNRITLRDWFQLCLKEGLTVYRDQEFSADERSRAVKRIKDVRTLRARQFTEDAGPLAHPVRPRAYAKIDNFYTATVYEKGAEVIRMLKRLIGDQAFADGMAMYFNRCDGTAATVESFIACFAEASGRDLTDFMTWYDAPGTPRVNAAWSYDAQAQTVDLHLTQSNPRQPKTIAPIPLAMGFLGAGGAALATRLEADSAAHVTHAIALTQERQTLRFHGVSERPIPSLLRGFSAPIILDCASSPGDRLTQMAHDPDPFTRWEAGQSYCRDLLLDEAPLSDAQVDALADALARELDHAEEGPAFAALTLRGPDLNELLQTAPDPDPDRLHDRRLALRARLAARLRDRLIGLVDRPDAPGFSASAAAAGARALTASALDLMAADGAEARIAAAFEAGATMSECMAALDALGQVEGGRFDGALAAFYDRWRNEPLVLDKWFSVQASAPRKDAVARVTALRKHPDFSLRNPNRARALVGAFATRNPRAFHGADGDGYRFVAQLAGQADALNPALAARLLTAFESWRRFDAGRRAHAEAAIQGLHDRPSLSSNARDVIKRALA